MLPELRIEPLDKKAMEEARKRQDELTKPKGSLGMLEELSIRIAGIKAQPRPKLKDKAVIVMAADHGVVEEGVSLYPQEVTRQMVLNFLRGKAAINVLARHVGARVVVVDMGVIGGFSEKGIVCKMIDFGTKNMAKGQAMTREQAVDSIKAGIEVVEEEISRGLDIVCTGDMGIGNTTAASAISAVIMQKDVENVTGRGTGINDEMLAHKIKIVRRAITINQPFRDAIDVLAKVGGFEIGGICGVILGAASNRIPVVIDGFISTASALLAVKLKPEVRDYLIASHCSAEKGHRVALDFLKLKPILNLNMRLGEGTGAALALSVIEASVKILDEMATFEEANVSKAKK